MDLKFSELFEANTARQKEWGGENLSIEYFGNALAGEVGEACNVIKKIARERLGLKGSTSTTEKLGLELADAIVYIFLIAKKENIDLADAVMAVFNTKSEELGFNTYLGHGPG